MKRGAVDRGAVLTVVSALVLGLALIWTISRPPTAVSQRSDELNAALDRGVGLMGQFDFVGAAKAFAEAQAIDPADQLAALNLAIATLNGSDEDSQSRARAMLVPLAAGDEPDDIAVRAAYCIGLIDLFLGEPESARVVLERAVKSRPDDAFAAFYLGQTFEMAGEMEQARPHYARAMQLDPLLRSAVLALSRCAMRAGDTAEGERLLARFEELANDPRAHLAEFKYTRMGPLAMATLAREAITVTKPEGEPFLPPALIDGGSVPLKGGFESQTLAVDLNGDPWTDLLQIPRPWVREGDPVPVTHVLVGSDAGLSAVPDSDAATQGLIALHGVSAAGDLNGDARTDILALRSGAAAWAQQSKEGVWSVQDFAGGIDLGNAEPVDLKLADLDGDADLDVVVVTKDGWSIWINAGDATFQSLAVLRGAAPGAPGEFAPQASGPRSTTLCDIDQDGDVDLILNKEFGASQLWRNEGLLSWAQDQSWTHGPVATTFVHPDSGKTCGVTVRRLMPGGGVTVWELNPPRVLLDAPGYSIDAAVVDVDGTGRPALVATQRDRDCVTKIWSLEGQLVQEFEGLALLNVLVNRDDRGPTLIGALDTAQGGHASPVRLAACLPGRGRLPFASFTLSGRVDPSQSMRSNASGVGTAYAIRNGAAWSQGSVLPHSSAGAQGVQPEAVGLAGRPRADFIRLDWPDALFQTELDLKPGHTGIVETQRQVSSCPVIFGWDGEQFQFVTDCLGVGGIGYLTGVECTPHGLLPQYAPPTPREGVLLPASAVVPREGAIEIRLGEPMEESCCLDAARLVAFDIPSGWNMGVDERLAVLGPPATGEPIFWRDGSVASLRAATVAGHGDATVALASADGLAAIGPPQHPRHIGLLSSPLVLTLAFDRPLDQLPGAPVLLMDGWVEYPYGQTNFAMWQEGISPEAPTIEALDPATGEWVMLQEQYGYPAGMPRLAAFPLDASLLPAGATTLRLTTTVELYIDRVRCVGVERCPDAVRRESVLLSGGVHECGFPARTTLPQKRPHFDYSRRAPLWDTRSQAGQYTAFGDCTPLLSGIDDACAIFGPGEEVRLRFEPPQDSAPSVGASRHWILELNGWCKDMDRFTGAGATLEPLPTRDGTSLSPTARALHDLFNTRRPGDGLESD